MRSFARLGAVILGVACLARVAAAQAPDTVITEAVSLAEFEEARALAVDPSGRLYVADAGRDVVVRLVSDVLDRQDTAVLGGPGTAEGEFDTPADVDPTNGLVIVVADAGNARIQRFSGEFRHLESLPVRGDASADPSDAPRGQPLYQRTDPGLTDYSDGRPIAVITSSTNETFAIDADRHVVIKWDAARRVERIIGGFDDAAGQLVEAVGLAVSNDLLYVADRGREAVIVFDAFGAYVRTLAQGLAVDVQAVTTHEGQLWIILPERLLVYSKQGRLEHVFGVSLDEPLVDVARYENVIYLLTSTRLLRAPL